MINDLGLMVSEDIENGVIICYDGDFYVSNEFYNEYMAGEEMSDEEEDRKLDTQTFYDVTQCNGDLLPKSVKGLFKVICKLNRKAKAGFYK